MKKQHPSPRHRFVVGLLFAALAVAGCRNDPAATPAEVSLRGTARGWNLLVVSVDTLRADRLNSYGYAARQISPAIDRLLLDSVLFEQAQASRALTWPSLASTLTGLHPSGHGLIENGYSFSDDLPTLPLLLRSAGYQTAAFLSNMCRANHLGWESFACAGGVDNRVLREVDGWIEAVDRTRPFLLWTHFFGPHPPYYNGGEMARELDPGYEGELVPKKWALDRIMQEQLELSAADRRHIDALYDAAVLGTDRLINQLLTQLRDAGLLERTIIVFLADHGEDLLEHNDYLYHACSVYQSALHVPLAVHAPGLFEPGRVTQPVELVDVLPTLLELLGIDAPSCQHGSSLAGYLRRPDRGGRGKGARSEYGDSRIRTYREGDWKLIVNPDEILPVCMADVPEDFYPIATTALFDLATDPGEKNDLSNIRPSGVAELEAALERHERSLCHPVGIQEQELPEDLKKELEALGYVAG